ncbi:uncharacterized protein LOC142223844 [Haematobia irritans]|uniref:uncharacterized protein LOC142223844 n=1 Tax=Haematobia irritans TaxID=7368 RepID=UPI003F503EB1
MENAYIGYENSAKAAIHSGSGREKINVLKSNVLEFVTCLYGKENLCRKDTQSIHESVIRCRDIVIRCRDKTNYQLLEMYPKEKPTYYRTERRGKIEFHPEEDAQTVIRKLKYVKLNIDLFYSKWGACSQFRLKQIFEECQNIGDILTKWPQYKRNDASVLIDIDFERIHPNHGKIENWKRLCVFFYF